MRITETRIAQQHNRAWWGRLFVFLVAASAFLIQALAIHTDINRRVLGPSREISLGPDLAILKVGEGAPDDLFRVGDRLTVVGDVKIATLLDYRAALSRLPANAAASIVVMRGTESLDLSAVVRREPLSVQFLLRHTAAAVLMALCVVVAYDRFREKAARLFFLSAITLGLYFAKRISK